MHGLALYVQVAIASDATEKICGDPIRNNDIALVISAVPSTAIANVQDETSYNFFVSLI